MITEELCYLTIDEAFVCMTDTLLPDPLRLVYCGLLIGK